MAGLPPRMPQPPNGVIPPLPNRLLNVLSPRSPGRGSSAAVAAGSTSPFQAPPATGMPVLDIRAPQAASMQVPLMPPMAPRSYAQGGLVPPMGAGTPMGAGAPGAPMMTGPQAAPQLTLQAMQAEVQRVAQQNPQLVQQMQQAIQAALSSGRLTMDQLNLALQLAVAAAQNPELYPRLRTLAIQRGLVDEDELPMQYDQSIVLAMLLAGAAAQGIGAPQGGMPQGGMPQAPMAGGAPMATPPMAGNAPMATPPGMADGGYMPPTASPTGDNTGRRDDILIKVSGGEYIIPKDIVERKGTDFFDKLVKPV